MAEELKPLAGPFEYLTIDDGQSVRFRPVGWEYGTSVIVPTGAPAGTTKTVNTLRVKVRPEDKSAFPYYWDLTAQTLIAQLRPMLLQPGYDHGEYTITKHGVAPKARFTVGFQPL
jgi:hypothetical protein